MNHKYFFASLTRISNLDETPFEVEKVEKAQWDTGQYVVGEVIDAFSPLQLELANGRMIPVHKGDMVVGALGVRTATLEATGDWRDVGDDGVMSLLTGAGLFGKLQSKAPTLPNLVKAQYMGHVHLYGKRRAMKDYLPDVDLKTYTTPTILIIGTSMSAGKTTAAALMVRRLKKMGLKVTGAKLAGAGRYRDTLWFADAGADHHYDFVDAGLPSTVCSEADYKRALLPLLSRMAADESDVAVIELGASPLEPYNGSTAIEALKDHIRLTVLSASDPYAVVGIMAAYGEVLPDIVTGPSTNTDAGKQLIENLTGIQPLNLLEPKSTPVLDKLLKKCIPT